MERDHDSPARSWIISATPCSDGHHGATRINERPWSLALARVGEIRLEVETRRAAHVAQRDKSLGPVCVAVASE